MRSVLSRDERKILQDDPKPIDIYSFQVFQMEINEAWLSTCPKMIVGDLKINFGKPFPVKVRKQNFPINGRFWRCFFRDLNETKFVLGYFQVICVVML